MSTILVVFASSHGQTRAIAVAIASRLRGAGHVVDLAEVGEAPLPSPERYDAVLIGSRIELGKHARGVVDYVTRHRAALTARPTAFFSVSMAASGPRKSDDPQGYLARFFGETHWRPPRSIAFAGALAYRDYGLVTRLVMKTISLVAGRTTDTSKNHEFTDWHEVERFADAFAADLPRRAEPAPVGAVEDKPAPAPHLN